MLVALPRPAQITDYEDFTGRTVARRTIEIRARVTGYLDKIHFKDGGDVAAGDVLFEIDPRPYQADLARAEAACIRRCPPRTPGRDFKRASNLIDSKSISREQYDLVTGDRAEADAAVRVAKAAVKTAQLNLGFTQVKAPLAGRISRTMLDPGNLVKADDSILTTLVTLDPIFAYFEVDERTLLSMRRYVQQGKAEGEEKEVPVIMGLADEEGFPHKGTINFVNNRLDNATGTLQVRGIFENSDHLLSPGLFVRVRLPIGDPYDAVLIDEQALGTDQGQKFVYVVDEGNKAQYRRIKVGKLQGTRRVVLDGLKPGERVVVSGLQRVRPGGEVSPKLTDTTAQAQAEAANELSEPKAPASGPVARTGQARGPWGKQ